MRHPRRRLATALVATVLLVACGDDDAADTAPAQGDRPTVVVTTNILGDVVNELVGDRAEVVIVMPVGANPHEFQASAQQANQMRRADVLVANGGGFEHGLEDVIEAVDQDGVPTYEAVSAIEHDLPVGGRTDDHGDDHGGDDDHGDDHDDDHGDDHEHDDDDGVDPHFFTDPLLTASAAEGITEFLTAAIPALDDAEFRARAADYVSELQRLSEEIEQTLSVIPDDRRVLVTNHEVFGPFADRYGFEVIGTVIPGGSTSESASAGDLAELADVIRAADVPAIFADTSAPARLADTLAREVGDVQVVELFSESLGEQGSGASTYIQMMRTNARRIAEALS